MTTELPVVGADRDAWGEKLNAYLTELSDATDTKAPSASPAFTGTPTGITKSHIGLGLVDNTADTAKPVSTAQGVALAAKLDATVASATYALFDSIVTAKSRGALTDGTTDDTAALVQAISDCPVGGVVLLPPGNTRITAALSITKSMTLRGSGAYSSRIFAAGCDGVAVAAGVTEFRMENIEIYAAVNYSITPHSFVGISVAGSPGSRPENHVYRDVFVNGFHTALRANYLGTSVLSNFRCLNGLIGLDIYGLSVNNFVNGGSQLNVGTASGSRGIRLAGQESFTDATAVASEGWTITDSLIFGGEIGVEIRGNTHCNVSNNIVDFCVTNGVLIRDNGTHFGGNCLVSGNYIALTGASGAAAVQVANTISNAQNTGNRITDNHCLAYSGATCPYGLYISGAQSQSILRGNILIGFGSADIKIECAGNRIIGNECLSTPGAYGNIAFETYVNQIAENTGIVYLTGGNPNVYSVDALGKKVWLGLQAHAAGTHAWGDRVINSRPTVGQPKGWFCTVAGTPGTWVADGNL